MIGKTAQDFFTGPNAWVLDRIGVVNESLKQDIFMDSVLTVRSEKISVNLTVLPLMSRKRRRQRHEADRLCF